MRATDGDVLVVIPCLNEATVLPKLLAQVIADTRDATIVVADGGSTDGSRAVVAEVAATDARVVLLDNPDRLQSAGINHAVRRFGGSVRWVVRMDAHCDYPADYIGRLVEVAIEHDATSVLVPMVSRGIGCFQRAAAAAQNSRLGTGGSPHRHVGTGRFVEHGHHALMDRALFDRVGGYRADMSHNEDAELDLRLAGAAGRLWLEPALALVYYPRSDIAALWRQYRSYGRGRARTLALHGARPKLRQVLPLLVPVAVLLALFAPIHPVFALPMFAWIVLCLGAGLIVGARAGGGCALLSGLAAMTMHLAWGIGFIERWIGRP